MSENITGFDPIYNCPEFPEVKEDFIDGQRERYANKQLEQIANQGKVLWGADILLEEN